MKNEILPEILSFERWVAAIDRAEAIFLNRLKRAGAAEAEHVAGEWSGMLAHMLASTVFALGPGPWAPESRSFYPSPRSRLFMRIMYAPSTARVVYDCTAARGQMMFQGAVSAGFTRVLHLALTRDYLTPGDLILLNSMTPGHPQSERARFMVLAKRAEALVERET